MKSGWPGQVNSFEIELQPFLMMKAYSVLFENHLQNGVSFSIFLHPYLPVTMSFFGIVVLVLIFLFFYPCPHSLVCFVFIISYVNSINQYEMICL